MTYTRRRGGRWCDGFGPWLAAAVAALAVWAQPAAAMIAGPFLAPDQAFRLSASEQSPDALRLQVAIARGYHLYKDRFRFTARSADVALGAAQLPPGQVTHEPALGRDVATYRKMVDILLPVDRAPAHFRLTVSYQGCADAGLCYAPIQKTLDVALRAFGGPGQVTIVPASGGAPDSNTPSAATRVAATSAAVWHMAPTPLAQIGAVTPPGRTTDMSRTPRTSRIGAALASGRLLLIVPMFLGFGLLLAFTPCVLPMLPILSGIIVGEGANVSRGRGLALSAAYALGMALVYTAMGVAAGLLGQGLAGWLQNPWVLGSFAALLVLLALSMFGFYELQVPGSLQTRLSTASGRLRGGRYVGVFVMGGISALIVGPCVAAPLAGALLYIGQTGNALIGGAALFALAAGMSVPLLLAGLTAGHLLPRAGAWMEGVKRFFGVLLIATALYMVGPVLPAWGAMALWALLAIVSATFLRAFDRLPDDASGWTRSFKGLGVTIALAGAMLMVGLAGGSRDLLQPLAGLGGGSAQRLSVAAPRFARVGSVSELDRVVADSRGPVMLDFYADWCVSCKEMEQRTFADPAVERRLAGMTLVQADVTANTTAERTMLARFHLFGPPGIVLFDHGHELAEMVGFQDPADFIGALERAGLS
ncbi:MAG: protein-disulfide reductase DsbD [Betaproteobacteria bacterium]|nr:protein-disulfide reductase DsbD [Betaproteobacteria bacterium]